ncbi:hypothetical protein [Nocardia australiensis]|uniref:hypothetical protein n=1 Tax=Nocardia australiensis TaxID=2887191 RepID=UPI001D155314|nr:hypothetical protein [Nocardia australiensis]
MTSALRTGCDSGELRSGSTLALSYLAAGLPIAPIAGRVGYGTPSTYLATFRRAVGVSPGRYFAG